jgi:hypothetical protein
MHTHNKTFNKDGEYATKQENKEDAVHCKADTKDAHLPDTI